jgi:predicted protein tyrosine phosphatase
MIPRLSTWFHSYGFADVHDDLLVGSYPLDAADVRTLVRLGVHRILNLVQDSEYPSGQRELVASALDETEIEEVRIDLEDHGGLPPEAIEAAVQTVVGWLEAGERTYLHCRAGWQRSPAVAAGVVAILDSIDVETALDRVQTRRPSSRPLPHQHEDLLRWWEGRSGE